MAAEDPTSALFSHDDAAESLGRKNLDIGFSAVMNALNQAGGALHEIIVPSSRVSASSSFLFISLCFRIFDTGLLFRVLLPVAGTNPGFSTSERQSGTASPRRPGYEEM